MKSKSCDWDANPAGHGHGAVVSEHVAIEGVERGIVDVGDQHALAQVVEHNELNHPAQAAKSLLMQFRTFAAPRSLHRLRA